MFSCISSRQMFEKKNYWLINAKHIPISKQLLKSSEAKQEKNRNFEDRCWKVIREFSNVAVLGNVDNDADAHTLKVGYK